MVVPSCIEHGEDMSCFVYADDVAVTVQSTGVSEFLHYYQYHKPCSHSNYPTPVIDAFRAYVLLDWKNQQWLLFIFAWQRTSHGNHFNVLFVVSFTLYYMFACCPCVIWLIKAIEKVKCNWLQLFNLLTSSHIQGFLSN